MIIFTSAQFTKYGLSKALKTIFGLAMKGPINTMTGHSTEALIVLTLLLILYTIEPICAEYKSNSRISRTISLQEEMEVNLTDIFKTLFQNYLTEVRSYPGIFMYICDKYCSTQNMFQNGLTSAFLLAVLSKRKFSIYPNTNTPFYAFWNEATYEWKQDLDKVRNKSYSPVVPAASQRQRYFSDLQIIEKRLSRMDFELRFKAGIVYLDRDHDWFIDLRRHPNSVKRLPWLCKTHSADFIRLVHNGLFRLSQPLTFFVKRELIAKVGENKLACFHGNNNDKHQVITFINFVKKNFYDNYKFYFSRIDQLSEVFNISKYSIREELVKMDFGKTFQNTMKEFGINQNVNMQLKSVIEIHVLKMCDVLIVSESPTGILAAHLRRKEENLYCYRNRVIFPCTRRLIAQSFRDEKHMPESVDIGYFCSRNDTTCIVEQI